MLGVRRTFVAHCPHGDGSAAGRGSAAGPTAPACYGPNVTALAVYLLTYQHIPVAWAAQLLEGLLGLPVSTGRVTGASRRYGQCRWRTSTRPASESTGRTGGCTSRAPLLAADLPHRQRGGEFGILTRFRGAVVNDGLMSYQDFRRNHAHHRFGRIVNLGLLLHPPDRGRKQHKARNLLVRLRDYQQQVLLFARDLTVPFANNQAERDLRMTKVQLKISGGWRTPHAAHAWLRVRGYISTARKHGLQVITALRDAIAGNPWLPTTIEITPFE